MRNQGQNRLPPVSNHIVNLTLNLCIIAVIYVILAAVTSTLLRTVFSRYNDEWKKLSLTYQVSDVSLELSFLVVASFWITYFVHFLVPVLPVDPKLEHFIELYGGRMVFVYAVFLFTRDLNQKLLFVYDRITGDGGRQTPTAE
jgi:hypothetical protein